MERLPGHSIGDEDIMTHGYMNATQQQVCELQTDKIAPGDLNLERQEYFPLSISSDYVKGWDTTAAFRELYQNWFVLHASVCSLF